MTGSRVIAFIVAACAVAATGLMAIPVESFEALGSGHPAVASPAPEGKLAVVPSRSSAVEPAEAADHASVPRLWLR
jgi:hypothetical protein